MKNTLIKMLSASILVSMVMISNVNAQSQATANTVAPSTPRYETGPHGGLICPAFENYKFEMVYREKDKKVDIYFLSPDGNPVESSNLTGEVTFVNEDKTNSKVNSEYTNKKFTIGVPDGKPLYMCGIVLTNKGQMYGGKFINPALIK